jgi:poly-gamma-glutamate synthesis protein (capsule biosynthesis protein)
MKWTFRIILLLACLLVILFLLFPAIGSSRSNYFFSTSGILPSSVKAYSQNIPARPASLWIGPAVPSALRLQADDWGIPMADRSDLATLRLDIHPAGYRGSTWIYALVAPFPTVTDGITSRELIANWKGSPTGPFAGHPLLMDPLTLAAFTTLWGSPASGTVQTVPAEKLLDVAWVNKPSWAIVPFELLDPRWKVLEVDDQSPIRKDFEGTRFVIGAPLDYPLTIKFSLQCSNPCPISDLPELIPTNRDPSKLTTLVMTGVTALVRATAYTMDNKGITYPGRDIRDWLLQADITHISNEVPFYEKCPKPNPSQSRLVFCSDPHYIDLLNYVGANVVELTGNHFADYGPGAMLETLAIYKKNSIQYYGGGADLEDAVKPLLLVDHNNKIAFIGCNSVDIDRAPTAAINHPGAAPCDYPTMIKAIQQLKNQGYIVISSFQYYETYASKPFAAQIHDFRMMADAGANIVQGSQAHFPQSMEFYDGAFIHYGLGNLFFDQMGDSPYFPTRREFIDRHVIYDGHYISTEILTGLLEDYSRPRPMTVQERATFLADYFSASGW